VQLAHLSTLERLEHLEDREPSRYREQVVVWRRAGRCADKAVGVGPEREGGQLASEGFADDEQDWCSAGDGLRVDGDVDLRMRRLCVARTRHNDVELCRLRLASREGRDTGQCSGLPLSFSSSLRPCLRSANG